MTQFTSITPAERAQDFHRPGRIGRRWVEAALYGLTLGALCLALWATHWVNPLRGDSAEYLYFDPSRSVGYPAFLEMVRLLTGRVALAVPLQITLLAASLLVLGRAMCRYADRSRWSLLFQLLLVAQAGMWFASAFIMTEALSTALVALWCAQLLRMMRRTSLSDAAILFALSSMATMMRPSLVALFVASALRVAATPDGMARVRALTLGAGVLVLSLAATPVAQWAVHGSAHTTSPLARGVLQHTLYCAPASVAADADARLVEQESAPVRSYIDAAPADVREQLRRSYSTPLRFGSIIPRIGRRHGLEFRSQVDAYLGPIASERQRSNPFCYAGSVAGEYARMTIFDTDPTAEEGRRANAYMALHPPADVPQVPVLSGDERLARRAAAEVGGKVAGLNPPRQQLHVDAEVPFLALLPLRLLFGGAALIGALSLLALPFRRRFPLRLRAVTRATAAMGLAFHGVLAITAIVEIGFFRYLVPLWPLVCTTLALGVMAVQSGPKPWKYSEAR